MRNWRGNRLGVRDRNEVEVSPSFFPSKRVFVLGMLIVSSSLCFSFTFTFALPLQWRRWPLEKQHNRPTSPRPPSSLLILILPPSPSDRNLRTSSNGQRPKIALPPLERLCSSYDHTHSHSGSRPPRSIDNRYPNRISPSPHQSSYAWENQHSRSSRSSSMAIDTRIRRGSGRFTAGKDVG